MEIDATEERKKIKLEDYCRLIMKLARPYAIREKCTVEDSEAYSISLLIFAEILPKWDPSRSSFATFLHLAVTQRLWKINRKAGNLVSWTEEQEQSIRDLKESKLYDQDLIDKLRHCLECFPPNSRERTILEMRLDGHTYKEIATVVGYSHQNTESYFKRNVVPVLVKQFERELIEDEKLKQR